MIDNMACDFKAKKQKQNGTIQILPIIKYQ